MAEHTLVKILYTSDVHGNAMPILYGTNEEAPLGLAKYATIVKQTRQAHPHVLVLDNGDLIQGTPLMTHYVKEYAQTENPMVGILNRIGVRAGVIGNHEFNFGKQIVTDAVKQSDFPWLSANIVDVESGEPFFGQPYYIHEVANGPKIAVIGVTTPYIPNWESPAHIEGIAFLDACDTLQKWVPYIREKEQPDAVIVSYHGGIERDMDSGEPTEELTGENQGYQICASVPGIDVLLTGHQHRILTGSIHDVLVLQPGNNGIHYGVVDLQFEQTATGWQLTNREGSIEAVGDIEPDQEIMTYMEKIEASTQTWLDQPIGKIVGDMSITDPHVARTRKHPFVEFIQRIQMDASDTDISVTAILKNDTTGFTSTVTMRDVVSNYMYPNTLVVLALKGKDILAALEKSADYFTLDDHGKVVVNPTYISPKPQHYNYDMWEGIDYEIHVDQPVGSRIQHVMYHGKPLQMDETYEVVLNNYRASGGGNFNMFKQKPVIREIQKDTVELIHEYFEKHPLVQATANPNFTVYPE